MCLRSSVRRSSRTLVGVSALLLAAAHAAGQAVVFRVTGDQPWRAGSGPSDSAWFPERNEMAISRDNRWVVFESEARNLILHDRNVRCDVFVFEVATGRIVGITSNESFTANHQCYDPAISGDGRFVVFASAADNLVSGDTNIMNDIFLVDRDPDGNGIFDEQTYAFERVSVDSQGSEANGNSASPCISDDGMRILFTSEADNLVANDKNHVNDAFLFDRRSGSVQRVDVDSSGKEANSGCGLADLSADGNVAAFFSYSDNLVPPDVNGWSDVFVHDIWTGSTEIVSVASDGTRGDYQSWVYRHCLSSDGTIVAFQSSSTNLDGDTNGHSDVFVHDRSNGVTTLVSVDSNGAQGNDDSGQPTISADGRRVTFASRADNFAAGDGNWTADLFLRDVAAGTTTLLSGAAGGGATSNGTSDQATISSDGTLVVFSSDASDLVLMGDTLGYRDVFLADLTAGTVRYVTELPAGEPNGPSMLATDDRTAFDHPALSADGRFVAFVTAATNLFDRDDNAAEDVVVADRTTGSIVPISVTTSGVSGNGRSFHPTISSTGRFVAFASEATNLIASDANGSVRDVLFCDRDPDGNGVFDEGNATTALVSKDWFGGPANGWSDSPSLSGDGTYIAFTSTASNLDPGDPTPSADICISNTRYGGIYALTSTDSSAHCDRPSMSSDGSAVAYTIYAVNALGAPVQAVSEWVYGVDYEDTWWIKSPAGVDPSSYAPCNSVNGRRVALSCDDHSTGTSQIEVYDVPFDSSIWTSSFAGFAAPTMNPSSRQVTVDTSSSLSSNDTNTTHDVYLFDLMQKEDGAPSGFSPPILVSRSTSGAAGNGDSLSAVPSEDGNLIVFASDASDLVLGDTNGCRDVFLYDRTTVARWLNYGSGFAAPHAIPHLTSSAAPVLGSSITLDFGNSSGVPVAALVYLGWNPANVTLPWGATFLVDLSIATSFLVPLGASGGTVTGTVPNDPALNGVSVYLQALEADVAVPRKLSFTPGLELHFGQ